ncbi:mediator complex subunit 13 C-terminal-domain-containing protein [Mycena maculata]|uniref:Mediator of RNA polymerase II transcription subunit 13 n=1 Tax=Mycena maculata TaxID=230809 RepID=A0AAD7ITN6_9AGAR|nr:mediator complex subunit 13 C-terminal-domain-containing protein [Mycena maculata]
MAVAASDKLLASNILLPKDVLVSCFVYSPIAGPSSHSRAYNDLLEMARRDVLSHNGSATLTRSILTSVHVRGSDSCMYAFLIGRQGQPPTELSGLHFDGLMITSQVSFTPADIFPCSSSCSELATPCSVCLEPPSPSSQQHLPRQPLRVIYSHFLEAVRVRLISDISDASNTKQSGRKHLVKRLKGGFLLPPPPSSTEWSKGWDTHASSRPLIFCQLQIHLAASPQPQLLIHPQLHTTPFLLLPHGPGRPLPEGAPITLLPHGTPAFYLASYSGPTSALRRQFRESLGGMGVSGWDAEEGTDDSWFSFKTHPDRQETTFIIAWISVENKQGEDKGITIIYPTSLCLSFVPSVTSATSCAAGRRESLAYIPELPPQLQPSPQVTAATPATATLFPPAVPSHLQPAIRPSPCPATPSPHALRTFRALTLSRSRGMRHVAAEVNGYVDAVAREREKERERLRRERERDGGSPRLGRANTSGPSGMTPAATPAAAPPATPQPTPVVVPAPPQPIAGPSQQPAPSNFYPSPPQVEPPFPVPPSESRTSPAVSDSPPIPIPIPPTPISLPPPTVPAEIQSAPQAPPPAPPPPSFDPYDPSYMDIDMPMHDFGTGMGGMIDMDMGMDFGMSGGGDDSRQRGAAGMDFETDFTDDDFSFFDRAPNVVPSAPLRIPSGPSSLPEPHPGAGLTPAAGPAPLGMGGMLGMSPPLFGESPAAGVLQGDWAAGVFTPSADVAHMMSVPELLPPSPGDTPNSHAASAPATPSVHLADDDRVLVLRPHSAGLAHGIFDPIPFAESHRVADGKYAMGKFALPSPPPEKDEELGFDASAQTQDNWLSKYASATDPRIGVRRKLIGVKRKTSALWETGRTGSKMSPSWVREHEDWEKRRAEEEVEAKSEPESDEDDGEEEDSPLVSRPSTPPPAYLPLGPTLLHTHFQHLYLLPLSTPLRPPGAAVAPTNITTLTVASASVPTPVSPAATLGAASEKSKSLEAAAFAVGKEVVENSVWAEAWRTTVISMGSKQTTARDAVWPADVKTVAQLLKLVPDVEGPLDVESLFGLDSAPSKGVQTLDPPLISIGKADAVIQVLPTALRFWEKLGLTPRGGRKNATVFVLFEDDGDARQQLAEAWLAKLVAVYDSKHLGTLTPGSHTMCPKDGIFSLRFDSTFRKNLAAFIASLTPPRPDSNLIFYVVTPLSTMSLASPLLRQVFSSVKKALKTHEEAQTLFHFVPEVLVAYATGTNPAVQMTDLEAVCYATYDRILQPVDRVMARRFFAHGEPVRRFFQDPAYALARPLHAAVKYTKRTRAPLDVMDAGTLLHVGYALSACGKWILAACVDERGEAHELAVWLTQTQAQTQTAGTGTDGEEQEGEPEVFTHEEYAARKVWGFACQFAQRANVAWRIVVTKLGAMEVADVDAWMPFLAKTVPACTVLPDLQVTLLSVEPDAQWTFFPLDAPPPKAPAAPPPAPAPAGNTKLHPSLPPKPMARVPSSSSSAPKPPSLYIDVSSTTYALFPTRHLPLALPPAPADLGLALSFVPESGCASPTAATPSEGGSPHSSAPGASVAEHHPHPLPVQPRATALLVRVPAASVASTPSMLHIGLLATFPLASDADDGLLPDITRSFHALSVLAGARWRLAQAGAADPILPFHLAAVDAMRSALERDGGTAL